MQEHLTIVASKPSDVGVQNEREGWIRGSGATTKGGKDHRVGGQDPRGSWGLLAGLIAMGAKQIKLSLKEHK